MRSPIPACWSSAGSCRDDIRANLEQWVRFVDYHEEDLEEKRLRLEQKLAELDTLIAAREESFDERHCFL